MKSITKKQLNRLVKLSKYIPELDRDYSRLSSTEAQELIQKYQFDVRIPKVILDVYGRDINAH